MGAKVYNTRVIQKLQHTPPLIGIATAKRATGGSVGQINRVKRNLFGCTVDSKRLKQFTDQQRHAENVKNREQWGFDFETGRPVEGGPLNWEPVVPEAQSPAASMVTLTGAAHVIPATGRLQRDTSCEPLSVEELMDDRAERANRTEKEQPSDPEEPESILASGPPKLAETTTTAGKTPTLCKATTPPPCCSLATATQSGQQNITEFFMKRKRLAVRSVSDPTTPPP